MKVLLAGGAGYIGSHTAIEMAKIGHEVVIADDFSNSKPEVLTRMKTIMGGDFPFYQIDVSDREALSGLFREENRRRSFILPVIRRSENRWKSRLPITGIILIRRSRFWKR